MRYILLFLTGCFTFLCSANSVHAQNPTLDALLATPFVSNLTASQDGSKILFTVSEKGKRNVYMALSPNYECKRITSYLEDDGQEITSLTVSTDGQWAVFVRGGDHGANSSAKPINPASFISLPKIQLYSISLQTAEVRLLGDGDFPVIHPGSKQVSFINKEQVWTAALDGSIEGKPLFHSRGGIRSLQWSPNGKKLAFTVRRGDHSFIGVFEQNTKKIRWITPSYYRDDYPNWSPEGDRIAFIRQPGTGGALDSLLTKQLRPWSIMLANAEREEQAEATEIWKAPATDQGSAPVWQGGFNLNWSVPGQITFLSYQDGWPHLYTVTPSGKAVKQLTKGNFSPDQISFSSDGKQIAFSANFGPEKQDIDRKHIGIVSVTDGKQRMITSGKGIESYPTFINGNTAVVLLSSTAQRPLLPAIQTLDGKSPLKLIGNDLLGSFNYGQLIIPEQITFKSEDGLQLNAQIFRPKNAKGKSPAIVYIHGGPRRQMYLGWHPIDYYFNDYALNQYLASKGFTVLSINYRMGTGYGFNFQNPGKAGNLGASEYLDILASGKWLANQKDVDANRIGVYGGSYGGYLTAFALAKNSELFKVGVDAHGVHNREKKLNEAAYAPDFNEAAKIAWDSSPSRWVDSWKSPVLIIHGDDDQNVPFSQSMDLVNRLKARNVQADYLVIPDDTHHWMLYSNLLRVKYATADYLMKYLSKESGK